MPQFDKITFFNQIFWLLISFSVFYLTLLKTFLPKLSAILKIRTKKLMKGSFLTNNSKMEISNVFKVSNQKVVKLSTVFRKSLLKDLENGNSWLIIKQKNLAAVKNIHKLFLQRYSLIVAKQFSI